MAKDWKGFEREVARLLTVVYYPDGDGEFRRVPQSGGWDKKVVTGDIMALKKTYEDSFVFDVTFPFSVECKTHRDIKHFFSGLYSKDSELFQWMQQAEDDCRHIPNRRPIVTFRLYRQKIVSMLKAEDFSKLKEMFGEPKFKYYFLRKYPTEFEENFDINLLVLCLFSDFVEWIDWGIYKMKYIRSMVRK